MNSLSWLLYLASVAENLSLLLLIVAHIGLIVLVGATFWYADEKAKLLPHFGKWAAVLLMCGVLVAVLPSKQTVYMIAASEMGERVAATPKAQEVMDLLEKKVREALAPSK